MNTPCGVGTQILTSGYYGEIITSSLEILSHNCVVCYHNIIYGFSNSKVRPRNGQQTVVCLYRVRTRSIGMV